MAQLGKLSPADPLSCQDTGQEEIDNRGFMIHAAGGNAEDGDLR